MSKFIRNGLIASVLLVFVMGLPVYADSGAVTGRPANPSEDNARTRSWFIYGMNPGETVSDAIEVINSSVEPKKVIVYATDSLTASGGSFSCEQKVEPADQAGGWIKISKESVFLNPGETTKVPFTLTLPATADVGEHSACIVTQDANQTPAEIKGGTGILLSTRSAVRVYITVPGDIVRHLEISGFSVGQESGHKDFWYLKPRVRNTGNVSVDTGLTINVRNILGMPLYSQSGGYTLMRGQETEWNFEMKRPFWGGLYMARFTAQYDPSTDAKLGQDTTGPKTILRSRLVWFFSKPTLFGDIAWMLLIILLIIAYVAYRRHKATLAWIKESWVDHTVVTGEDLTSLGARHKIDWRIIATANQLKPPFSLKGGEKIKVPPAGGMITAKAKSKVKSKPASSAKPIKKTTQPKKK